MVDSATAAADQLFLCRDWVRVPPSGGAGGGACSSSHRPSKDHDRDFGRDCVSPARGCLLALTNSGVRLNEFTHQVRLLAELADMPYLKPTHDELEFVVHISCAPRCTK